MRDLAITVTGMHCAACGLLIDDTLLDVDGVVSAVTDVRTGVCLVSAQDSVTDASLLAAVAEAGYEGSVT